MHNHNHTVLTPTDNQIADLICRWLVSEGFTVTGSGLSTVNGPDVIAHHPTKGTWRIVARNGQAPYEEGEISDHVVTGFFSAATIAEGQGPAGSRIGLALKRSLVAERRMSKIRRAMSLLGIVLLWVEPSGDVTIDECRETQAGLRPEQLNASNDG